MWSLATQSALVAILVSMATTAALLLRGRRELYMRFGAFALSIGAYYTAVLLGAIFHKIPLIESLLAMIGGAIVIFAARFFDTLLGEAGYIHDKRRRKTYIGGFLIIAVGATPLASILFVQILIAATALFLLGARVRMVGARAKNVESAADATRLRYLAYAGTIALSAFCFDLAASVSLPVWPIGGLAIALYLYFISQTLIVSRLLDLHELIGKGVVFGTLALILASVYGILVVWVGSKPGLFIFNTLIASGIILILFDPLKSFLEEKTTKLFFREHLTFSRDLRLATRALATIVELQPAVDFVLDEIYDSKRATHASIYIFDAEKMAFSLQAYRGPTPPLGIDLKQYPVLFRNIIESQNPLLYDTIERRITQQKAKETMALFQNHHSPKLIRAEDHAMIEGFHALYSELIIPLRNAGNLVGFMSLQDERLTEAYAKEEIACLLQLGEQLAITIQNSRVFAVLKEKDRLAALGEMSAGLAHEIRNPLAAIKGAAQVLDPIKLEGSDAELLQIIVDEVNRLNKVVTEFLDYARPFRGTFSPFNLNEAIRKTLQLMEHDLPKEVEVKLDLDTNLPDVSGDPEQVRQVLINLILNAKDAMNKKGSLKLSTRLIEKPTHSYDGTRDIELCVQDSGSGIPGQIRDKIFIPFFTTKQRGTGLGLALCQRIVRDHGGNIEVRSVQGRGSAFIVKLPTYFKKFNQGNQHGTHNYPV